MKIIQSSASIGSFHPSKPVNQDRVFVSEQNQLYAVIDGVSSADGEFASEFILQQLQETAESMHHSNLREKIKEINAKLSEKNEKQNKKGSATASFLKVEDSKCKIIHTGDTRIYRFRNGKLERLTKEFSILNSPTNLKRYPGIDLENMSDEEREKILHSIENARSSAELDFKEFWFFKHRGTVLSWLGSKDMKIQEVDVDIQAEDMFLLCSDGLYDNLTFNEIEDFLSNLEMSEDSANELCEKAVSVYMQHTRGMYEDEIISPDDISAIIVKLH
jgi:protein phosphatase